MATAPKDAFVEFERGAAPLGTRGSSGNATHAKRKNIGRGENIDRIFDEIRGVRVEMDRDHERVDELLKEVGDLLERKQELEASIGKVEEIVRELQS